MPERIFVVGHGAVTCLGPDMNSTWQGLRSGQSGIRRHPELGAESFLQDIAGKVEHLEPDSDTGDRTLHKLSSRFLLLAVKAAREAWTDAGIERREGQVDRNRVAVMIGSALGGVDFLEAQQARMKKRQDLSVSPFLVPGLLINQAAGQVAQLLAAVSGRAWRRPMPVRRAVTPSFWADVSEVWRCGSGALRGKRERVHAGDRQRFFQHEGLVAEQARGPLADRSRTGKPAVQHRSSRVRDGRGLRDACACHRSRRSPPRTGATG